MSDAALPPYLEYLPKSTLSCTKVVCKMISHPGSSGPEYTLKMKVCVTHTEAETSLMKSRGAENNHSAS